LVAQIGADIRSAEAIFRDLKIVAAISSMAS
jgi:hypothetical protein